MNKKVLHTLEFDKILKQLESLAVSPLAKKMATSLSPYTNINMINEKLQETDEATNLICKYGSLPLGGIKDITTILKRLQVGGILSISELMNISELLRVVKKIKSYGNQASDYLNTCLIANDFNELDSINHLYNEITRCIISEEEIADDASDELYKIRKEMNLCNSKVRQQLNKIISSSSFKSMLQEPIITVKNDRFCVPVKAEYKNSFPGMIHEHSASGSTLFIEPMAVVDLNNKIRTLMSNEEREIQRILATLSALSEENIELLNNNQKLLSKLDFVFAKGELSLKLKCSKPIFNTEHYINLKKARHPLLDTKTVVPTDLHIGKEFNTLVVTGPNTGGKTVTLKTVGLISIMGQAGLHIPAFDNSILTVFDEIYADIGDEQSIEQSLSTFSSHMVNIVEILKHASENSLVLFDELGAGTDPTEGAALAMAILDNLFFRNIITIATTHYSELKVYALSTKGVENACCEFDVKTLRPTYRLLIGIPGKSNAFAISKRLGLSDDIINESKLLLESKAIKFEDLISDLESNKKNAEIEKDNAARLRLEAEALKKELEDQKAKLNNQRNQLLKSAKEEAYAILQEAKEEADTIIKEMNSIKASTKDYKALEKNRTSLRESLTIMSEELVSKKAKSSVKANQIKKGDQIYVSTFEQEGIVLEAPNNKGEVFVQLGIIKSKVPLSTVTLVKEKVSKKTAKKKGNSSNINHAKVLSISSEIDVRGSSSEEAITEIDKYLDDAYLAHLPTVTIIHGKGTGVLRKMIHSHLKNIHYVKSYRLGAFGEGDSGVTIVTFK